MRKCPLVPIKLTGFVLFLWISISPLRAETDPEGSHSKCHGQIVFGVQQKATAGDIPSFAGCPFPFRFDGVIEAFKGVTLPVD
jgi:hypothetical protein